MIKRTGVIGEEAVHWVVRLNSDQRTRADEEGFRAWLEEDPAHARAYAESAALWEDVGDLAATDEAHDALKPLRTPERIRRRFNRRIVISIGVGAAIAAMGAGLVGPLLLSGQQTLQTAPGEQKRVPLSDGSSVLLNTDSRLRVGFTTGERRLFLDRGQVFFQAAHDKTRPFRVFVGRDEVRALGTAFEVRRIGEGAQVTLEEGRVSIYRAGSQVPRALGTRASSKVLPGSLSRLPASSESAQPTLILSPGEQALLASAGTVEVHEVDIRKVQAWRYGRMILDDAPLGETVADLNRYGGVQIVLADPKMANIRVSGVFHTGRPEDFVESIAAAFPIVIARQDANTLILKLR